MTKRQIWFARDLKKKLNIGLVFNESQKAIDTGLLCVKVKKKKKEDRHETINQVATFCKVISF